MNPHSFYFAFYLVGFIIGCIPPSIPAVAIYIVGCAASIGYGVHRNGKE